MSALVGEVFGLSHIPFYNLFGGLIVMNMASLVGGYPKKGRAKYRISRMGNPIRVKRSLSADKKAIIKTKMKGVGIEFY